MFAKQTLNELSNRNIFYHNHCHASLQFVHNEFGVQEKKHVKEENEMKK